MPDEKVDKDLLKPLFKGDKVEGRHRIALYLVQTYCIKTLDTRERNTYIYQNGIYKPAINFLKGEIENILGSLSTGNIKNEIVLKVQDMTLCDREVFNPPTNLINLKNGVYDITTKQLLPHSSKYNFLTQLPVNYNPEATCPNIQKFMGEVLYPEDIPVMEEFLGFALFRRYFIKKAMILVGERDTGKTTLLNIIEALIGKDNISGISLQKIGSDKFATASLYQKYLNSFDDLSFKDIKENGQFKMATGGGSMGAENKYESSFKFENFAKLIFSANKIPVAKDNDDLAYFARWIVLIFDKKIEKPDALLKDKLVTPEELSGLLNLALGVLMRLMEVQKFSYTKEPFEIKQIMQRSGSSIANFVENCIKEEADNWISKDEMFESFVKYVSQNGMKGVLKQEFGKELQNYAGYITDGRQTIAGKQITSWRNVAFIDESSSIPQNDSSGQGDSEEINRIFDEMSV